MNTFVMRKRNINVGGRQAPRVRSSTMAEFAHFSAMSLGLLLIFSSDFITRTTALRLTFPPARDWNDFISNQNSESPCGVYHSSGSPVTTLSAGNQLNVTWSLSYANTGGFQIELLRPVRSGGDVALVAESTLLEIQSSNGSLVSQYHMAGLTNETLQSWGTLANPTAQWAMVNLPFEDCYGCTIRLIRQAFDLQRGNDYHLWSCADVNIATSGVNQCHGCNNNEAPCGFNTMTNLFECTCDKSLPQSGTYCERVDECVVDMDCGPSNAKCIDIRSTNSPSRQCYCLSGWRGEGCQTSSDLDLPPRVDLGDWHTKYQFNYSSANFSMFWKVVEGPPGESADGRQIEVALAAKTNSYVAVGWRPSDLPYEPIPNSLSSNKAPFSTPPPPPPSLPPPPSPPHGHPPPPAKRKPTQLSDPPAPAPTPQHSTITNPASLIPGGFHLPRKSTLQDGIIRTARPPVSSPASSPASSPVSLSHRNLLQLPFEIPQFPDLPQLTNPTGDAPPPPQEPDAEFSDPNLPTSDASPPTPFPQPPPHRASSPPPATRSSPKSHTSPPSSASLRTPPSESSRPRLAPNKRPPTSTLIPPGAYAPPPLDQLPMMTSSPTASPFEENSFAPASEPTTSPPSPPRVEVEVEAKLSHEAKMPPSWAQDMTIGTAKGSYYRVKDAWSLPGSYSTPISDTVLGGTDDILDANGHEEANGWTYFVFRRPFMPSDADIDYVLSNQRAFTVVWAKGQSESDWDSSAVPNQEGMEAEESATKGVALEERQFYKADDITYHGKHNAGVIGDLNLVAGISYDRPLECPTSSLGFDCQQIIPGTMIGIQWNISLTSVYLGIAGTNEGWISLGFSPATEKPPGRAKNALVVVGRPNAMNLAGNGSIEVYKIANNTAAGMVRLADAVSPVGDASVRVVNGSTVLRFESNFTTVDGTKLVTGKGTRSANLVWAAAPEGSNELGNHFVGNRGAVMINFDNGQIKVLVSDPTHWYELHGLLMWAAFGFLFPLSYIFGRFAIVKAPRKQPFHHYMHYISTLASFVIAIAATVIAFQHFAESPWGPLRRPHGLVGLAALVVMLLGALNGALCRPEELGTRARRMWTRSHWVLGMGLMVCATCAAVLGLQKFHDLSGKNIIVYWTIYGGLLAVLSFLWLVLQFAKPHERSENRLIAADFDSVAASKGRQMPLGSWPPENVTWPSSGRRSNSVSSASTPLNNLRGRSDPRKSLLHKNHSTSESSPPILPILQPHGEEDTRNHSANRDDGSSGGGGPIHRTPHMRSNSLYEIAPDVN